MSYTRLGTCETPGADRSGLVEALLVRIISMGLNQSRDLGEWFLGEFSGIGIQKEKGPPKRALSLPIEL